MPFIVWIVCMDVLAVMLFTQQVYVYFSKRLFIFIYLLNPFNT